MEIQGLKFQVKESNLNTKRFLARLSAGLQKVIHLYLKDVDFSLWNNYQRRYALLNTAKGQIENIIDKKQDSKGDLNEEQLKEYEIQLESLNEKLAELDAEYSYDIEAQSECSLKKDLEELAFAEFATDEKLLRPILKEILIGEVDKIDFNDKDFPQFLANVTTAFFLSARK